MVTLDTLRETISSLSSKYIHIVPEAHEGIVSGVIVTYDIEHLDCEEFDNECVARAVADQRGLSIVEDDGALKAGVIKITVNGLNATPRGIGDAIRVILKELKEIE